MGLGKQAVCNKRLVLVLKKYPRVRGYFYASLEADAANIVPVAPVVVAGTQATIPVVQVAAIRGTVGDRRPPVTAVGTVDSTAAVVAAGNWGENINIQ